MPKSAKVLKDIADAVAMHESTISRVTTGSLIQTPRGTMELKAFFSVGIQQEGQNETTSATSIKFKIKKLIEWEKYTVSFRVSFDLSRVFVFDTRDTRVPGKAYRVYH